MDPILEQFNAQNNAAGQAGSNIDTEQKLEEEFANFWIESEFVEDVFEDIMED